MRTFVFTIVIIAVTLSAVLSHVSNKCTGGDTSTCSIVCPHQEDFVICHDGLCHCHHLAGGTCTGNDVSGCTGGCEAGAFMICFNSQCHCEHESNHFH